MQRPIMLRCCCSCCEHCVSRSAAGLSLQHQLVCTALHPAPCCAGLCRAAAEPYFAMLERWLGEGLLDDPYMEFMIQEDKVTHWVTNQCLN